MVLVGRVGCGPVVAETTLSANLSFSAGHPPSWPRKMKPSPCGSGLETHSIPGGKM